MTPSDLDPIALEKAAQAIVDKRNADSPAYIRHELSPYEREWAEVAIRAYLTAAGLVTIPTLTADDVVAAITGGKRE
jgi:hypothetical protein